MFAIVTSLLLHHIDAQSSVLYSPLHAKSVDMLSFTSTLYMCSTIEPVH